VHRTRLVVVAAGAALLGPAVFTPGPAAAARFHACAGTFAPDGTAGGGFYGHIRAKRTGCATARSVTRAWVRYEAMTDGANPTGRVRIRGYSCRGRTVSLAPGDLEGGLSVLCTRGHRAVSFLGHP
jgi:hypothetical protein